MNTLLLTDYYKVEHHKMYNPGCTLIYSNLTPRKSRMSGVDRVVVFGIQYFIKKYLINHFNENFFNKPIGAIISEYKFAVGTINLDHIVSLHKLGYLPIELKSLPEGTLCPIGVPVLTIKNTLPEFFWLTNYLETLVSTTIWQPITSATIAYEYKKILNKYALETAGSTDFVPYQGHDFSMRGMSSVESAISSGMGHLTSFLGTDVIPAIYELKEYYAADTPAGGSVPATEHSIMCLGEKSTEIETFKRLLDLYPAGILSVVSDTWDLWKVCTEYLPALKEQILAREGKLVIRPDSGDPVDIICGTISKHEDISKYFPEGDVKAEYFAEHLLEEVREDTPHGECGVSEYETVYIVRGKKYKAKIHNISWNRFDKQYYFIEMWEKAKVTFEELEIQPADKGVIELLWNTFGGTVNEQGYKVLDSHIGAIYGDSITLDRAKQICERLIQKGFASTNVVLGIGSYTYQYNTRDTFGFAMKATYGEVLEHVNPKCLESKICQETEGFKGTEHEGVDVCEDGCVHATYNPVGREIFKDPITDDGTKRSKKGLLRVVQHTELEVIDQQTWAGEEASLLTTVFKDGKIIKTTTLEEIRSRLANV